MKSPKPKAAPGSSPGLAPSLLCSLAKRIGKLTGNDPAYALYLHRILQICGSELKGDFVVVHSIVHPVFYVLRGYPGFPSPNCQWPS